MLAFRRSRFKDSCAFARGYINKQSRHSHVLANSLIPGRTDKLYTNLGYLYLKIGQPEQAVNSFNAVAHATFKPIIGLALAYYRSGQLEQSYSIYNSVLASVVGQDDEKAATILVAMASMVYEFQGERDTKTVLYQW